MSSSDRIDKLAWIYVEDRRMLFARTKGKDAFYNPGGKRLEGETDQQALIRELKEELDIDLIPSTIKYLNTFAAQAHGKPDGVMVEIKCYTADFSGEPKPSSEIEELAWLNSRDAAKTSPTGKLTLEWLKEQNLID